MTNRNIQENYVTERLDDINAKR